jgi:hypothetical protein
MDPAAVAELARRLETVERRLRLLEQINSQK